MARPVHDKIIKTASWNAGGTLTDPANKELFKQFLKDYSIDIFLLQETWFKTKTKFNVTGYHTYRNDRPTQGGGTAILIKKSLPHATIIIPTLTDSEATAIELGTTIGAITFTSLHKRPQAMLHDTDIDILSRLGATIVIAGDLNAKRRERGCHSNNTAGRKLLTYVNNSTNLTISPPTRCTHPVRSAPHDILDIVLHSSSLTPSVPQPLFELHSDHLPILFALYLGAFPYHHPQQPNFTTNWKEYRDRLAKKVNSSKNLTPQKKSTTN